MDKLISIMNSVKPGVDFSKENNLIDNGILDSFDIVSIVSLINQEFDIEFPVSEILPENFNSLEALLSTIEKIK